MGRVVVQQTEGMVFRAAGASGHGILMDASREFGGEDSAPRPVEIMLSALGGCTAMDVVSILRKMNTEPTAFRIEIDDKRAPNHPKTFTDIHLTYILEGDVPEKNVAKAIELSLTKYCPIANTLAGTTRITSEYRIVPSQ